MPKYSATVKSRPATPWNGWSDAFKQLGSLDFSKFLLKEAKVAVSPGGLW